jgi:osmotically-inducible protein OsmY
MKTGTTDKTVEDAVRRELEWDPKVSANHLGVTAKEGAIVLMGVVSSNAERLAAVRAAERVYGVRTVADETTVELPDANVIGDAEIAETIARQLRWNTVVPDTVEADVRSGYVTLRGTVEWSYQREEAERPINLVRGIYLVTNLITVEPCSQLAAKDLEQRVHEAISRMADLDARSIGVTASDGTGTVHLDGSVHSLADRRIAEHAAASAPGVREVQNDIVVTP